VFYNGVFRGARQSQDYRKQQSEQKNKSNKSSGSSGQYSSSSTKNQYLKTLGLDPNKSYSFKEIKRAYRKQSIKWHPDKHQTKGEEVVKEMNKKFKVINEAFKWLALNTDK